MNIFLLKVKVFTKYLKTVLKSAYFYNRFLKKRKMKVCDADTYHCALALCQYYKKEGKKDELIQMCNLLLTSTDEGAQREARSMLACTLYCVC